MDSMNLNLTDVELGESAKVTSVTFTDGDDDLITRRLLELGFIPGTDVQVLYAAPIAKDPRSYLVRGMHIALRRDEARRVLVTRKSPPSRYTSKI